MKESGLEEGAEGGAGGTSWYERAEGKRWRLKECSELTLDLLTTLPAVWTSLSLLLLSDSFFLPFKSYQVP